MDVIRLYGEGVNFQTEATGVLANCPLNQILIIQQQNARRRL